MRIERMRRKEEKRMRTRVALIGAEEAIAPANKCGYFNRIHADKLPEYDPPHAIHFEFGILYFSTIYCWNEAKSANLVILVK